MAIRYNRSTVMGDVEVTMPESLEEVVVTPVDDSAPKPAPADRTSVGSVLFVLGVGVLLWR